MPLSSKIFSHGKCFLHSAQNTPYKTPIRPNNIKKLGRIEINPAFVFFVMYHKLNSHSTPNSYSFVRPGPHLTDCRVVTLHPITIKTSATTAIALKIPQRTLKNRRPALTVDHNVGQVVRVSPLVIFKRIGPH